MANLRANNLTGTGGRNAIDGSVFFEGESSYLTMASGEIISGTGFGTNDFTIEFWINQGVNASNYTILLSLFSSTNTDRFEVAFHSSTIHVYTDTGAWRDTGYAPTAGVYEHIAFQRDYSGNTLKMYANGVEKWSVSNNHDYNEVYAVEIGSYGESSYGYFEGYLSNFRICTHLVYASNNFTPPTQKLGLHPETILLCCQDSDNALQEATGKTITGYGRYANTDTELVTNHSFNNGTTGWTLSDASEGSMAVVNGSLVLTNDDSSDPPVYAWQAVTTVIGQTYDVKVHFSGGTGTPGSNLAIYLNTSSSFGSSAGGSMTADSVSGNGIKIHRFKATVATTYLILRVNANAAGTSIFSAASMKASDPGKAPKVLPPYGIDEGVVVDGYTKINSPGVMYFPTGDTSQRGRGTALFGGGYQTPNSITAIDYLSIQSGGLTQEWGNLSTTALASGAALGSYTRWVTAGGWTGANNNAIEYVTFTTQGNSLEFGDLVVGRRNTAAVSNSTRGIWGGGYIAPADAGTDSMDYITIASTGNAADFGNLSAASKSGGVAGSTTRAVWALGLVAPADNNTLEYVTIATTGNVTNFGDMPSGSNGRDVSGCSSNVRGIYGGGQYPTSVNIINYITIATTGDAVDFGDLTLARGQTGATSNGIRGVFMGGTTNPARVDNIDSVIIATTGNAVNWGDFRTAKTGLNSAASDSHGGLS